jgi:hypothetical protein
MSTLPVQFEEVADLVWALANDSLDDQGAVRLQQLLDADPANRRVYIELMDQFASLEWEKVEGDRWQNRTGYGVRMPECRARIAADLGPDECSGVADDPPTDPNPSYAIVGSASPASAFPQPSASLFVPFSMLQTPLGGVLFSYLVATVILGMAMTVAWAWKRPDYSQVVTGVRLPAVQRQQHAASNRNVVGRVIGMVDCQWVERDDGDSETELLFPKSRVHLNQKIALASGLMEIAYDSGANVILEGPVTYVVDSPAGGYLSLGKLTAQLEKKSEVGGQRSESADQQTEIINHQFAVRTPTAIVTDLGTEFGVEVDKTGRTFSHVFRGVVRLETTHAGPAGTAVRVLHENESARVETRRDADGNDAMATVTPIAVSPVVFVRKVPKPTIKSLSLVDLTAGGNGSSKHRDRGIDPLNGKIYKIMPPPVLDVKDYTIGDRKYHRVEGLPGVDGVFIPDGSASAMTVDSAGHAFGGFPKTSNETTGYIWTGGALHFSPPFEDIRTVMGGVDFGTPDHAILYLQSNQGITFDLDAIRRANPGWKMMRFRSTAGNTERASERGMAVYADLWVLVDGQVRFRRREISGLNGAFSIVVPLGDSERFLTLATTDGGNGIGWDQVLYGDPELELNPIRIPDRASPPTGDGGEGR